MNNGPRLVTYDNATGEEIASADLPRPTIGTRMTYILEGRQYVTGDGGWRECAIAGGLGAPGMSRITLDGLRAKCV
jgi:hypothetical protein